MKGGNLMDKDRIKWFNEYFKKDSGQLDPKYQEYLDADLALIKKRAFQLLSITENDLIKAPVILLSPETLDPKNPVSYKLAKKPDLDEMVLQYDQSLLTILLFGKDQLYYYQVNIDHRFPFITNDFAGEVLYFDIINIETSVQLDDIVNARKEYVDLQLWLSDGSLLAFRLRERLFTGELEEVILTKDEASVLDIIRKTIRERRTLK